VIAIPASGLQVTDVSLRIEEQQACVGITRRTMRRMQQALPGLRVLSLSHMHTPDQCIDMILALPDDFTPAAPQTPVHWQLQHGHFVTTVQSVAKQS
jgi:hypothetical protein